MLPPMAKNPHAVALGTLGASKGGRARAKKLTRKRRQAIGLRAATIRWAREAAARNGKP